jgi:hypothetical protein
MKIWLRTLLLASLFIPVSLPSDAPPVAGRWQFVLEMSHGTRNGTLQLQQEGEKLTGTGELEKHGATTVTGSIRDAKVSLTITLHGGSFTLVGTFEKDKMSGTTNPAGGTWKATRQKP